jgi:LytS/YehU family sensor histidine kinase
LHGLAHKKDGGSLSVRFSDGGDCTVCTIRDNGIGRAASLASKTIDRPSRGMAITERRAALLFHNDQHVRITDLYDDAGHPAGTEVVVRVPKDLEGSHAPPG